MMIRKGGRTMLGFVPITRLPVSDNRFDIGNVAAAATRKRYLFFYRFFSCRIISESEIRTTVRKSTTTPLQLRQNCTQYYFFLFDGGVAIDPHARAILWLFVELNLIEGMKFNSAN
jgi:hypothetical protein